ncbi:hypothetical protein [Nonomuraea dietziae]|uniref:hypothetical protein n=1 Tax=Nonomuraea dietziae TaxID=65515 RepID=UPI0033E9B4A0
MAALMATWPFAFAGISFASRAADYDQHVEEAMVIFHPMQGGVALFIAISVSLGRLFRGRP